MKLIVVKINLFSNLVRGILLVAIIVAVKYLYDHQPVYHPDVEPWGAWDYQLTFRLFVAFVIVLIGTFFNNKVGLLISMIGLSWVTWEYVDWYRLSYNALNDPGLGYAYREHKLGLILATWGHIALLIITIVLLAISALEIYRKVRHVPRKATY
jgi:hypothetical protein